MQRHREFDTAISAADVEHMQRSHGALAEHEFDLSNFARILHDSAFEVAAGGHDDALGRGNGQRRDSASISLYRQASSRRVGRIADVTAWYPSRPRLPAGTQKMHHQET